jgi:putative FmdB family regulatory protein
MPTYDYVCQNCDHAFEEFQSMSAPLLKKCPKCGKAKLKRLIGSGAGIIFKGSGFYQTDYRSDSYTQSVKNESGSTSPASTKSAETASKDSKAETKSETSSETKSETKTETKVESKAEPTQKAAPKKKTA